MFGIDEMNEMFAMNHCTDGGRVVVDYCPRCEVVVVKVLDEVRTVDVSKCTAFGAMYAVLDEVKKMYDSAWDEY